MTRSYPEPLRVTSVWAPVTARGQHKVLTNLSVLTLENHVEI